MPSQLNGSFYSGTMSTKSLELDHIVPQSHMLSAGLVTEFADPSNIAFNTVFCLQGENAKKGDRFLPLSLDDTTCRNLTIGKEGWIPDNLPSFNVERRMMAARAVCATYLSLFLLERQPSGHTEMGSRPGGFYEKKERCEEAFKMATDVKSLYKNDKERKRCLNYERGLALLQFYYLGQPYNPLPDMAYKQAENMDVNNLALWPYYKDLLFKRFRNKDLLSELMRVEARDEIAGMPAARNDGGLNDEDERKSALSELKKLIEPDEKARETDDRGFQNSKRPRPSPLVD